MKPVIVELVIVKRVTVEERPFRAACIRVENCGLLAPEVSRPRDRLTGSFAAHWS